MELKSATDKTSFNNFVANHGSGSFLQAWEWGEWQEQLGKKVFRFFVMENEKIILSAQVIKTPIPRLKKYYLYIPYGPLSTENIFDFFISELKKQFPDTIFIRIESKNEIETHHYSLIPTSHIQPGKTLLIDLKKLPEELLAGMHPKTRYNIKVAQKHEVKITSEPIITPRFGLHLEEAAKLLIGTASRQKYKTHGIDYYKNLINFFGNKPNGETKLIIYKALLGTELLATALMIDFGKTRTYLFGGTSEENKKVMAPYALHWQAINDAQKNDFNFYDFWGIMTASGQTPGFVRFKLGFGGHEVAYPATCDIRIQPLWYNAYKLFRSINKKLL